MIFQKFFSGHMVTGEIWAVIASEGSSSGGVAKIDAEVNYALTLVTG